MIFLPWPKHLLLLPQESRELITVIIRADTSDVQYLHLRHPQGSLLYLQLLLGRALLDRYHAGSVQHLLLG